MQQKKVVVIGGGTGTYTVLRGLKAYKDLAIAAIVTMADDGGSNKILRDEFGLLPTSGVRQCLVALSQNEGLLRQLFSYRYYQGVGIAGMTFGNLFMAAVSDVLGDQRKAIKATADLLSVVGQILPVSYDKVSLLATYADGTEVLGEHLIDRADTHVGKQRVSRLRTVPVTKIDREAREAIVGADMIILGPGDLYTNTIANLVVPGVTEAIMASKARLVFVMNLMTKMGESYNYTARMFLEDLGKYVPRSRIDCVVLNTDLPSNRKLLAFYKQEQAVVVKDDLQNGAYQVIREKLLSRAKIVLEPGDKMVRSTLRHDSKKLAKVLVSLL